MAEVSEVFAVEGRVALITGGGQGIGRAIARRFLEAAMRVVLAEVDREAGLEAQADLQALGEVLFIQTDVADEDSVRKTVQEAVETFGRLDVLVNNAGIGCGKPVTDLKLEEWNRVIGVNLTGAFLCAKHAAFHLEKSKGVILNIASTRAHMSERDTEAYSASKGGILALTHALSISLGPAVRVNCISPGWINVSEWKKKSKRREADLSAEDHEQHACGRVGKPEDIAALALFLVGEESGFITGSEFVVDGGMTRKMIYVE